MILNFISNFITHTGTLYFSFRYKPNSHSVRRLRPLDPNRDSPLYSTKVLNWSLGPQSFSNMNFYIKLRSLIVHFVLLKCSRPRTFAPWTPPGFHSWTLPGVCPWLPSMGPCFAVLALTTKAKLTTISAHYRPTKCLKPLSFRGLRPPGPPPGFHSWTLPWVLPLVAINGARGSVCWHLLQ